VAGDTAVAVAADHIACGSRGKITVVDVPARSVAWSTEVDGTVYGLAIADGRLFASTDQGGIYCFGGGEAADVSKPAADQAAAADPDRTAFARAADEIVRQAGTTRGDCVDLGCGDGSLAYELAQRTQLQIYAVDDDPANVAAARSKLHQAGLYGTRVVVHHRDLTATGYPQWFANLVVSGRTVHPGAPATPSAEMKRLQRPFGGTICLGSADKLKIERRGPLPGAGSWTHQYADAANTVNSNDTLVHGRLTVHWFRDIDFDVPQRHGRGPSPLFDRGRLFHAGLNGVIAVDAYNGHELWRYEIEDLLPAYDGDELMGVSGTGSTYCVGGDHLYVRNKDRCLALDVATGELKTEFHLPPTPDGQPGTWGYLACVDDVLYGTSANEEHVVTYRYRRSSGDLRGQLTESRRLFAVDTKTGQLLWNYQAQDSIRHNAIAVAGGKVFLIDRPLALSDREKKPKQKTHASGRLLALNARTGEVAWKTDENIYGTMLAAGETQGVLLMSYQPTRFRLDSELGGRMTAYRISDGRPLWDIPARYDSRPLINGDTIYAQGGAWNLHSGQSQPFQFQRSYGCGIIAAGSDMLVFRSATLGYCDLAETCEIQDYGGIRPGCWINAFPAGGLVLAPDATAGCRCSYLNKSWIALQPQGK
jgi:outer membrane protein assembly factor BamB